MSTDASFDIAVIGGGTAGMTAAARLAGAGRRVALIEADRTGGDCLYTGCVPSKSLLATARRLHQISGAGDVGVSAETARLDLPRAVARKDAIIARIGVADAPERLERAGITVISGRGRFLAPHRLAVAGRTVAAEHVVIATGSRPAIPPIPGIDTAGYVTNAGLMDLTTIPRRLAVIGAGPTGLELGQAFARFGSEVTIVEQSDRVLERADAEIAVLLRQTLAAEGIRFILGATVEGVTRSGAIRQLHVRRSDGTADEVAADTILVATGRQPNVEELELDRAGVAIDGGGVCVDRRLRTTTERIWACGDVIGPPYLTHAAEDQARMVAGNILGGRATWSGRALPRCVFTDPALASVGQTEDEARQQYGDRLEVLRLPYTRIDRAVTDGATTGEIKILLAPGWMRGIAGGEVVGAHILGAGAGELIHELSFLMTWRLPAGMLVKTVHVYPTYALGLRQALGLHWRRQMPRPGPIARIKGMIPHRA